MNENTVTNSILYHAVDYLPSEINKDASQHFGSKLLEFVPNICYSDSKVDINE